MNRFIKRWSKWKLLSKLTVIGFVLTLIGTVISIIPIIGHIYNNKSESYYIPKIAIRLFNHSDTAVSIISRNEFILWLPQGMNNIAPNISGKIEMVLQRNPDRLLTKIEIKAHDSLSVQGIVLNDKYFYNFLKAGDSDIDFMIRKTDGQYIESSIYPFTNKTIKSGYIPIIIE